MVHPHIRTNKDFLKKKLTLRTSRRPTATKDFFSATKKMNNVESYVLISAERWKEEKGEGHALFEGGRGFVDVITAISL